MNTSKSKDSAAKSALHNLTTIVSLENREQRADVMNMVKSLIDLPAPISADTIRRLFQLENQLNRVIQNDKKWFFANSHTPDGETFARDLIILHGVTANTLTALLERRGEWSKNDDTSLLRDVIAFAIFHFGAMIKWSFFRREPIKATIWPQLHKLYQLGEQEQLVAKAGALFVDEPSNTTITSLYIRALLLDVFNSGSLNMAQIEIADGWLAAWAPIYSLDRSYDADIHTLFVDLNAGAGLNRIFNAQAVSTHRYLRLEGWRSTLQFVRDSLRAGRPYHGRGIPNLFSMEEHVSLLASIERLSDTMLDVSIKNIDVREHVHHTDVQIVLGFDAICHLKDLRDPNMITTSTPESTFGGFTLSLEPLETTTYESGNGTISHTPGWILSDISVKGMGFIVKDGAASRVEVGQLMAVKIVDAAHATANWILTTVVRKLEDRDKNETLIGAEVIAGEPVIVNFKDNSLDTAHETSNAETMTIDLDQIQSSASIDVVYMSGEDKSGLADIVIVPINHENLKHTYTVSLQAGNYTIRLNRVTRKGIDWAAFRFRVIASS